MICFFFFAKDNAASEKLSGTTFSRGESWWIRLAVHEQAFSTFVLLI